jgi:hypothetical protein
MVTDRTTDGARPAIMANENREIRMRLVLLGTLRVLGIGFSKKLIKSKNKTDMTRNRQNMDSPSVVVWMISGEISCFLPIINAIATFNSVLLKLFCRL